MSSLRDKLILAQTENLEAREKAEDVSVQIRKSYAKNQSKIAMLIVIAFVIFVALIFVLVGYSVVSEIECDATNCASPAWKESSTFLLTVVSSVMLPIVTLVLGYYFGTEQSRG